MGTEYRSAHTAFDWLLEAIALAALVTATALVGINWEAKRNLWLLPILGWMHYLLLSVLARVRLSPQHETDAIRGSRVRILTWIKASMLASLAYIAWNTIETVKGRADGLESGFVPAMLIVIVLPVFLIWRKMRSKQ